MLTISCHSPHVCGGGGRFEVDFKAGFLREIRLFVNSIDPRTAILDKPLKKQGDRILKRFAV
jgi:hypothetical protein